MKEQSRIQFSKQVGSWLWDRFTVRYTPKHGRWLNQAEIAISLFSRQCLGLAGSEIERFKSMGLLKKEAEMIADFEAEADRVANSLPSGGGDRDSH